MDRIVVTSSGKDIVLCDWSDTLREGVALDFATDLQVVKLFRGAAVVVYDRKNASVNWPFTVIQEWADLLKSFNWFSGARQIVPAVGDVTWQSKGEKGSFTRYIKGAGIQVKSLPRIGVATITQYNIIGGQVTTS